MKKCAPSSVYNPMEECGLISDVLLLFLIVQEIRFSSPKEDSGLSYIIRLDKKDNKRFVLRPGMRNRKKPLTEQEARDKFTQSLIANGDEDEDKDGV